MVNKQYNRDETAFTWDKAGSGEVNLMDLGGLASGSVAMGSFQDLGATPRSFWYKVSLLIDGFATDPIVNEAVLLYLSMSDATSNFTGNPTTDPTVSAQGTMTTAQLGSGNVMFVGANVVYSTTAVNELMVVWGRVWIPARYVSPVVHNNTNDALLGTSDAHLLTITPIPFEMQ